MREIKFRAWNKEDKLMGEPFTLHTALSHQRLDIDEGVYQYMQLTGLKDKNGKEIYESDCFAWGVHRCEIVWDKDGFGARNQAGLVLGLHAISSQGEVIGNVWENPELIPNEI